MTQSKFQLFSAILPVALAAAEGSHGFPGKSVQVTFDLVTQGPANNLGTVVNTYGVDLSDPTNPVDTKPLMSMITTYVAHIYDNGPKPEWLTHAGL